MRTHPAPPDRVALAAVNSGPGIAAHGILLLFQRYQQTGTGRQMKGTGMGLFIVKALAEAHGGTIEVQSSPGGDTCFTILLPVLSDLLADCPSPSGGI